jgi:DNA-binding transcriptional LysR family regulator
MELRQLELVVAIADEGTFTAAATRLRIAQPAVSHQIRQLERQLGYRLFTRSARGAAPTPQCRLLLPAARAALTAMDDARAVAAHTGDQQLAGRVRLGAAHAGDRPALTAALAGYARAHPHVDLSITHAGSGQLMQLLTEHQLDLAVLAVTPDRITPGLHAHWLPATDVVAVTAPTHPLAALAGPITLRDALAHPLITLPPGSGLRVALDHAATALAADPRIAYQADDLDTLLDLAGHGLGVALLPATATAHRPDLTALRLQACPLRHHTALAWTTRPRLRPAPQQLRDHLATHLGSGPSENREHHGPGSEAT